MARSAAAVVCFASFALAGLCFLGPRHFVLTGGRLIADAMNFTVVGYGMLFLGLYRVIVVYQVMTGNSRALICSRWRQALPLVSHRSR